MRTYDFAEHSFYLFRLTGFYLKTFHFQALLELGSIIGRVQLSVSDQLSFLSCKQLVQKPFNFQASHPLATSDWKEATLLSSLSGLSHHA